MPNTENRKNSNKKPTLQEHSQTVIIPQLTPEMLEQARRAAEQGKTAEQIEQEALAAAQAEQKAVESKQEAPNYIAGAHVCARKPHKLHTKEGN